jgi:hypothetical protein
MQLVARGGCFPPPAGGRLVDHAQERSDREPAADLEPWTELLPRPAVHPNLAPLAAFPSPNKHRAAGAVKVTLVEGERFTDPQPRASQQHDAQRHPAARIP